jgi:hypothetical protein
MNQPQPQNHIRQVVLPSGKTIQVVYYQEATMPPSPPLETPAAAIPDLHVCVECNAPLVYPVKWEQAGPHHWDVWLRCPNCEWYEVGTFHQEIIDRFDEALDNGSGALERDLRRVTQANMEEEIESFMRALDGDHILPMDF